jgi:hypothetical protein
VTVVQFREVHRLRGTVAYLPMSRGRADGDANGVVEPSWRVPITNLLARHNCTGVYLDFGTNVGVQIRKLFASRTSSRVLSGLAALQQGLRSGASAAART